MFTNLWHAPPNYSSAEKKGAPKDALMSFWYVAQSIALKANSPPSLMPENQRAVTVLVRV